MDDVPGGTWLMVMNGLNEDQKKKYAKIVIAFAKSLGEDRDVEDLRREMANADTFLKRVFFISTFDDVQKTAEYLRK